ncbi:hypothetical protein HMPREF1487_09088 [Pseudomonas sp. HPB0071]|uniref:hypothetical protein n=1 Tax=unclassified Pseudomonas TaxID=196821 RepID=UPI0002CAB271|nr:MULTISPECIES: hypothetical protein [unclassified Pseudomonas]ENA27905.1 hypothetical protein HMPREF1487_09088 [Pseudomonas sp. HPB0071]
MDRDTLIRHAQLEIFNRYQILVDCSALEESVLKQVLEKRESIGNLSNLTFARWCDQVLGEGIRVPVARFDPYMSGQTRLGNLLQVYHSLHFKPQPQGEFLQRHRHWYRGVRSFLLAALGEVKDVEGHIFNYQGASNRDYRSYLSSHVLQALAGLSELGLNSVVELEEIRSDSKRAREPVPKIIFYQSRFSRPHSFDYPIINFSISEMPFDILTLAEGDSDFEEPSDPTLKFSCQIKVYSEEETNRDDIFHLSCFLHKLFLALAKSADHVARGILREKLILALLLTWTAPCMATRERTDCYKSMLIAPENLDLGKFTQATQNCDASAGAIIAHLFSFLQKNP